MYMHIYVYVYNGWFIAYVSEQHKKCFINIAETKNLITGQFMKSPKSSAKHPGEFWRVTSLHGPCLNLKKLGSDVIRE